MFPFLWFSDIYSSSDESSSDEEYKHFYEKRVHFLTTNNRKGKCNSHQSHKKHKKLTSPVKGPTSPVRENISPVREQRKSPVRELPLSPVREDQSSVRVTSKTGEKRQDDSNDSEKRKTIHWTRKKKNFTSESFEVILYKSVTTN